MRVPDCSQFEEEWRPGCHLFFLVDCAQQVGDCAPANPMRGTFIGHSKSPASSTSGSSLRIAPVGNRASPSDHDHTRPSAESRFQSDLHVTHDFNFHRHNFRNQLPNGGCSLLITNAGNSHARTLHLPRINACRFARLSDSLVQRLTGASFAHAIDVAGPGRDPSQYGDLVPYNASCLAAAAIDAEEVRHGSVLPQYVHKPSLAQPEDCLHN
jgi:hypothetical protein